MQLACLSYFQETSNVMHLMRYMNSVLLFNVLREP